MAQTQDALLLREAVTAAKVGNKAAARQLLRQASVHNPNNELVWLWRASLSESPKEAIFYLGEVLRINPQNQKASAWLDKCKGHTPATTPADGPKPVGQNVSQPPEPAPAAAAQNAAPTIAASAASPSLASTSTVSPAAAPASSPAPAATPVRTMTSAPATAAPSAIPMPPVSAPAAAHVTQTVAAAQPKPVAVAHATSQTVAQPAAVGATLGATVAQASASIQNLVKSVQPAVQSVAAETVTAAATARVAEARVAEARVNEARVNEGRVNEGRINDARGNEARITENRITDNRTPDHRVGEGRVNENRVTDHANGKFVENRPKPTVIPFVATKSSPAPALKSSAQPAIAPANAYKWQCPFCSEGADEVQKRCSSCHAITVLEDLKEIEQNEGVHEKQVRDALSRYEAIAAEKRTFEQNSALALGHLNLREATSAIPYLKAATAQRKNEWALLGVLDQLQWRKVVLVVDDSLTIRKALSSILEKNDYRVLTAEDGSHALELLNETVPDLVLLDITMPWMDGYQVCKHIKEKALTRKVPVIMLSGKDGLFDKVRGKLAGCNDYVTKPFDPDALLKTIKKYLP